jgi:hypothetical protein
MLCWATLFLMFFVGAATAETPPNQQSGAGSQSATPIPAPDNKPAGKPSAVVPPDDFVIDPPGSLEALRDAQTAYYRASADKIIDGKTLGGWFKDNAAVFSGLAAAIVAFLSFYQSSRIAAANLKLSLENSRSERRSQRDTQFYEALKRLGDKDSPALRAGAAALIAQLARRAPSRTAGYLEVAVDQFAAALRMEREPVVIEAVGDAIRYLAGVVSEDFITAQEVIERIYRTNRVQQDYLRSTILRYFLVSGMQPQDGVWPIAGTTELVSRTGFRSQVMEAMLPGASLAALIQAEQSAISALDAADRSKERAGLTQGMHILGIQLRASSDVICVCLQALTPEATFAHGPRRIPGPSIVGSRLEEVSQDLRGVFLSEVDLRGVNLKGADLREAKLLYTNLFFANLEDANLSGALLDGATLSHMLKGANLSSARLTNTHVGQTDLMQANLEGANWWDANFDYIGQDSMTFDRSHIDQLFEKYGPKLRPGVRRRGDNTTLSGKYIVSVLEKRKSATIGKTAS